MEIWKDIKGYKGFYQVSNMGNVRSLDRVVVRPNGVKVNMKGKVLKVFYTKGYALVTLIKNDKRKTAKVHRLVAQAFLDKVKRKNQVNHANGKKADNVLTNLEWCTNQENTLHAYRNGLIKRVKAA